MTPRQRLRAVAVEVCGADVGCADGSCVFGHPGGMVTNGGCQCLKDADRHTLRRLARVALRLAEVLCVAEGGGS